MKSATELRIEYDAKEAAHEREWRARYPMDRKRRMLESKERGLPWLYSLEKGPNGKLLCRACGTEVSGRRQTWCSDDCGRLGGFYGNFDAVVRRIAWDQSDGVCAGCYHPLAACWWVTREGEGFDCTFEGLGHWEVHHVVPLCEGGWHEPKNVVAMCRDCHKAETKALAGRRAAARKQGDQLALAV